MTVALTVSIPVTERDKIVELAQSTPDFAEALPMATDASRPLNSGVEEVKLGLELLLLGFKTASAALVFLTALRTYVRSGKEPVKVSTPKDGSVVGVVRADTSDDDLKKISDKC